MEPLANKNSRTHEQVNPRADSGLASSDPFVALPRNCDTAVVYWNIEGQTEAPMDDPSTRLCIQINGRDSNAEECIFLHREAGHFIVPLLADDRNYEIELGWSDASGFRTISSQAVQLPEQPSETLGAMSSSLSYRGAHFWPKNYDTSVN